MVHTVIDDATISLIRRENRTRLILVVNNHSIKALLCRGPLGLAVK
jgi:hypothetical protein